MSYPIKVWNGSNWEDIGLSGGALSITPPPNISTSGSVGSSSVLARSDHTHGFDANALGVLQSVAASAYVQKSLVNAKGDLITATANDTPAILTAGSNGQMLMADSSATAGLRYVDPPANRNLIINGAMQVAQRATSKASITADGYYTADRWLTVASSLGTWTQSVEADGPTGSGLTKSLKMLCTTADAAPAAGDLLILLQRLEGQDLQRVKNGTASAEQLTLSFWVKANVTGTYIVNLVNVDASNRNVSASYTVNASATWERKTITFPADTAAGAFDNDNGNSLAINWWLGAGTDYTSGTLNTSWASLTQANRAVGQTNVAASTNNYWQITGVQLETGPVATPFEFEPYEATLRKCQRYYWRAGGNTTYQAFGVGQCQSSTQAFVNVQNPVPMRATPTAIEYSTLSLTNSTMGTIAVTNLTLQYGGSLSSLLQATVASGIAAGNGTFLNAFNSTSAYFAVTAEL